MGLGRAGEAPEREPQLPASLSADRDILGGPPRRAEGCSRPVSLSVAERNCCSGVSFALGVNCAACACFPCSIRACSWNASSGVRLAQRADDLLGRHDQLGTGRSRTARSAPTGSSSVGANGVPFSVSGRRWPGRSRRGPPRRSSRSCWRRSSGSRPRPPGSCMVVASSTGSRRLRMVPFSYTRLLRTLRVNCSTNASGETSTKAPRAGRLLQLVVEPPSRARGRRG